MASETTHGFLKPALLPINKEGLRATCRALLDDVLARQRKISDLTLAIDERCPELLEIDAETHTAMLEAAIVSAEGEQLNDDEDPEEGQPSDEQVPAAEDSSVRDAFSYMLGVAFSRWDIRFATGEKPVPELPDPFAPLPACPPGMLQNEQGLPLTEDDVHRLQAAGQ